MDEYGRLVRILKGHQDFVYSFAVWHGHLVSGSGDREQHMLVWDKNGTKFDTSFIVQGTVLGNLKGHLSSVRALSVWNNMLVSTSYIDKDNKVWIDLRFESAKSKN